MSHLALVADNRRPPPPPPGYQQALRDGICQRCRRAAPVRTVGMRRRDQLHFRRLALCATCIVLGREQGYPVVS